MAFFRSLLDRFSRSRERRLRPESLWVVMLDDETIGVKNRAGSGSTMRWEEVTCVAIATDDSGPWGADVWWLFHGPAGGVELLFPQGATGEAEALDRIFALPGVRHEEIVKAMACTEVARFVVWERDARMEG